MTPMAANPLRLQQTQKAAAYMAARQDADTAAMDFTLSQFEGASDLQQSLLLLSDFLIAELARATQRTPVSIARQIAARCALRVEEIRAEAE